MTWDEFKAFVDAALREEGAGGDVRIWYIDVASFSGPPAIRTPRVSVDGTMGLSVST